MVVKMESETRTHVGNKLEIHLKTNLNDLIVIGNKNSIKIGNNEGIVKVVGDDCVVDVGAGRGRILVTGNGSRVSLGDGVLRDRLQCVGNNAKVGGEDVRWKQDGKVRVSRRTINCVNVSNVRL